MKSCYINQIWSLFAQQLTSQPIHYIHDVWHELTNILYWTGNAYIFPVATNILFWNICVLQSQSLCKKLERIHSMLSWWGEGGVFVSEPWSTSQSSVTAIKIFGIQSFTKLLLYHFLICSFIRFINCLCDGINCFWKNIVLRDISSAFSLWKLYMSS